MIPPIGQVVRRVATGMLDWVCLLRLGDEQSVLCWGSDRSRFRPGLDRWEQP